MLVYSRGCLLGCVDTDKVQEKQGKETETDTKDKEKEKLKDKAKEQEKDKAKEQEDKEKKEKDKEKERENDNETNSEKGKEEKAREEPAHDTDQQPRPPVELQPEWTQKATKSAQWVRALKDGQEEQQGGLWQPIPEERIGTFRWSRVLAFNNQPALPGVDFSDILAELWFFERLTDNQRFLTWDTVVVESDVPDIGGKPALIACMLAERYTDKQHRKVQLLLVATPSLSGLPQYSRHVLSPSHISRPAGIGADSVTLATGWYFRNSWINHKLSSLADAARSHMATVKPEPSSEDQPSAGARERMAGNKQGKPKSDLKMGSPAQAAVERALAKEAKEKQRGGVTAGESEAAQVSEDEDFEEPPAKKPKTKGASKGKGKGKGKGEGKGEGEGKEHKVRGKGKGKGDRDTGNGKGGQSNAREDGASKDDDSCPSASVALETAIGTAVTSVLGPVAAQLASAAHLISSAADAQPAAPAGIHAMELVPSSAATNVSQLAQAASPATAASHMPQMAAMAALQLQHTIERTRANMYRSELRQQHIEQQDRALESLSQQAAAALASFGSGFDLFAMHGAGTAASQQPASQQHAFAPPVLLHAQSTAPKTKGKRKQR